ncbi:helix-turn-helix domain-containing protein [Pontibacter arcticus]|uniref:Uncharacterized protein n=1 Tax=Pontibacter arcticus TaxID=2080288 RepID=A0A364RCG9_9BACT|nr:hypothetical protein [Pontibacter arcticus]RAU81973.1 hypothetical protein DP923_14940 [Pontibacter arcticus]
MNEQKPKEFNPLAFNILRLQNYTDFFDLPEIVLFEWFMVKANSFKRLNEFYYSIRRIAEETRIRKAHLSTIIKKFEGLGIIQVEKKGMPKCSYFSINKEKVIALIPEIYQFTENGKLLPENGKLLSYFGKLLPENSKHKGTYKEHIKEPKKETSENEKNMVVDNSTTDHSLSFSNGNNPEDPKKQKALEAAVRKAQREAEQQAKAKALEIGRLKNLLNSTYAQRVTMHNADKKKGERVKSITKLSFLQRNEDALYELSQQYGFEEIENSFIAYADDFLAGNLEVSKLISYFLSKKPQTKDFDTFHTYLNKYTADYSYTK